jgi:hypothetical protein
MSEGSLSSSNLIFCKSPVIAAVNISHTSVPLPVDQNKGSSLVSASGWNIEEVFD